MPRLRRRGNRTATFGRAEMAFHGDAAPSPRFRPARATGASRLQVVHSLALAATLSRSRRARLRGGRTAVSALQPGRRPRQSRLGLRKADAGLSAAGYSAGRSSVAGGVAPPGRPLAGARGHIFRSRSGASRLQVVHSLTLAATLFDAGGLACVEGGPLCPPCSRGADPGNPVWAYVKPKPASTRPATARADRL